MIQNNLKNDLKSDLKNDYRNPFLGQMTINSGLPSGKKFLSFEVNNTLQKHLDCMFPENILCIAIGSELEEESVEAILPITKVIEIHNELVSSKIQNQDDIVWNLFYEHESADMVTGLLSFSFYFIAHIYIGTSGQIVELLKVFRIVVVGKLGK